MQLLLAGHVRPSNTCNRSPTSSTIELFQVHARRAQQGGHSKEGTARRDQQGGHSEEGKARQSVTAEQSLDMYRASNLAAGSGGQPLVLRYSLYVRIVTSGGSEQTHHEIISIPWSTHTALSTHLALSCHPQATDVEYWRPHRPCLHYSSAEAPHGESLWLRASFLRDAAREPAAAL